ncbi:NADH-ubiquinone oxidoreductase chain M [Fulvivirga imtechensis AK7]|uniref:NADH-ubiquinone oxidoreductase chain M n=1 Tax=Fulvivirga imtechensis AK7 TaxID=1237149 RepID=L8JNJ4_9BACT|nr:NADH-quinone oxidoreductase subunit M [Fulvivirga imtechensis]ELR70531.1 NADH-ubiquinone oxidoreductase chain M [Fulvivirga imtechensis AK7]
MLNDYLLSTLIFLPLTAAVIIALLPQPAKQFYKYIALFVCFVQLILAGVIYFGFNHNLQGVREIESFQYTEFTPWINFELASLGKLSANYFVGVDGLSVTMVLLSVVVLLIGVVSSWNITEKAKGYFSLYLVLNAAIIGCFVALDFLLFYLFFEFMLLPMYFLIGLWGGPRRDYASIKFFLYTLLGSVLILIVMIMLYLSVVDPAATAVELNLASNIENVSPDIVQQVQDMLLARQVPVENLVHTFNMVYMTDPGNYIPNSVMDVQVVRELLGQPARLLAFLLLFIGFAIKIPVVPVHTWLPDAHVEAPTPISVVLAGVLLKVGAYGLIRTGYLIIPDGAIHYAWWIGLFGVISIIYGAMCALASRDLKKLIAYSSVSHMGFVLLGLASLTSEGVSGAIYQMVSHGIISAALFLIAGVVYDRSHNRIIENYSGLASKMPKYSIFVIIFFFASMGLPGFSGFIAEVFVLLGSFSSSVVNGLIPRWMTILAATGLILSASYYLWTIQRMFFGQFFTKGPVEANSLTDINRREYLMFIPLFVLALLLGIFPGLILDLINQSVSLFVETVNNHEFKIPHNN